MNADKNQFDRLDLLHAWLDAQKHRNSHEVPRDYYERIATAFCKAFKVDLDHLTPDRRIFPDTTLNDMFAETVQSRQACISPFSHYIQAPLEISELYQCHGKQIETALGTLIREYDALLLDLLERIHGIKSTDFVSRDDLNRCGFPCDPAPADIDYF